MLKEIRETRIESDGTRIVKYTDGTRCEIAMIESSIAPDGTRIEKYADGARREIYPDPSDPNLVEFRIERDGTLLERYADGCELRHHPDGSHSTAGEGMPQPVEIRIETDGARGEIFWDGSAYYIYPDGLEVIADNFRPPPHPSTAPAMLQRAMRRKIARPLGSWHYESARLEVWKKFLRSAHPSVWNPWNYTMPERQWYTSALRDIYLRRTDLDKRGWTHEDIQNLLAEPDLVCQTPQGTLQLYYRAQVAFVEESEGFLTRLQPDR